MINLEQIRLLEAKINTAVDLIASLREENRALKQAVDSAQSKMQDLETLVDDFKTDQGEIEECIMRAIQNLDRLEGDVSDSAAHQDTTAAPAAETPEREEDTPDISGAPAAQETPSAYLPDDPDPEAGQELDIF
jgi:chromosome segregation ATPase